MFTCLTASHAADRVATNGLLMLTLEQAVRLAERWIDWRSGTVPAAAPLTPEQRACLVRQAWALPPAYRLTQPADPVKARETWQRASQWYLLRHRVAWQGLASSARLVPSRPRHVSFFPGRSTRRSA